MVDGLRMQSPAAEAGSLSDWSLLKNWRGRMASCRMIPLARQWGLPLGLDLVSEARRERRLREKQERKAGTASLPGIVVPPQPAKPQKTWAALTFLVGIAFGAGILFAINSGKKGPPPDIVRTPSVPVVTVP